MNPRLSSKIKFVVSLITHFLIAILPMNLQASYTLDGIKTYELNSKINKKDGGQTIDETGVPDIWKRDPGNAQAQYTLGVSYQSGIGVDQNLKEAVRLYKLSADQRYAPAQYNLGVIYDNGIGVDQNLKEAVRLYKLSADRGYPFAP